MKILWFIVIPFAFGVYYTGSSIHRAIDQVANEWIKVASEIRGFGGAIIILGPSGRNLWSSQAKLRQKSKFLRY